MTDSKRPVALVTGASRGLGAACAIGLARKGFDVSLAARTVREGEGMRSPSGVRDGTPVAVAGSLETTAAAVEAEGSRALSVRMDLLDRASLETAVDKTLATFGRIDVLVNNAIDRGPSHLGRFLDTELADIETALQANVISQMLLLKRVLPLMIEQGGGIVVQMTSAVASNDPPAAIGKGGWSIGYACSKGGFDRMAGVLNAELGDQGIRVYNIEPGFVYHGPEAEGRRLFPGVLMTPAEAIGAAVAYLATEDSAGSLLGKTIHGPQLCAEKGLLPGWDGPS